ncbi:hypothetical protein JXL19_08110 [bacterium]|nr:hypothetical protein [bacterium]
MRKTEKIVVIGVIIIFATVLLFSIKPASAQLTAYPGTFGTTSVSNYSTFPTFSTYAYPTYPFYSGTPTFTNYSYQSYPYYGTGLWGSIYPGTSNTGILPSSGIYNQPINILQLLQIYQYLAYAYQFYQIARVTPFFYQTDLVADYIGSSLYSFANQNNLDPQAAIISFIQQNLL